jgi:general secretion pathway protein C
MMKRLLDRHEWAVDIAAAVLCASALAHAYAVALERPRTPAPPAMVIAAAEASRRTEQVRVTPLCSRGRSYYLERGRAEEMLAGASLLPHATRIVPEIHDGDTVGFRLYSVRPGGSLEALGFRNGDIIRTINDLELSSPEKALEIYAKLRSVDDFVVSFERNGETLTNDYHLR